MAWSTLRAPHDFIDIEQDNVTVFGLTQHLPVRAQAHLNAAIIGRRLGSGPQAGNNPPGFVNGGCPEHHQRGHLIANQLGGPGICPNLVTLTEGTNHPYMAEFEAMARAEISANPGVDYVYDVKVIYNQPDYIDVAGGRIGVMGSPYCVFPAPTHLYMRLYCENAHGHKIDPIINGVPPGYRFGNYIVIGNGTYKFHSGSVRHVQHGCWASANHTPLVQCARCTATRTQQPSMLEQWHFCPQHDCGLTLCGTCGAGQGRVSWFDRRRYCPNCRGTHNTIMVLW